MKLHEATLSVLFEGRQLLVLHLKEGNSLLRDLTIVLTC